MANSPNLRFAGCKKSAWLFVNSAVLFVSASLPACQLTAAEGVADPASAVCMLRYDRTDNPKSPKQISIILPSNNVLAMEASGFEIAECKYAFASHKAQLDWRDEICVIAATVPEAMQNQLARRMGADPGVLCGMAELVLGQWDAAKAERR